MIWANSLIGNRTLPGPHPLLVPLPRWNSSIQSGAMWIQVWSSYPAVILPFLEANSRKSLLVPGLSGGTSAAQQRSSQQGQQLILSLRHFPPSQPGPLMCLTLSEGTLGGGASPVLMLGSWTEQRASLWAERGSGKPRLWTLCTDRPGFKSGSLSSATFCNLSHPHFFVCQWNQEFFLFHGNAVRNRGDTEWSDGLQTAQQDW